MVDRDRRVGRRDLRLLPRQRARRRRRRALPAAARRPVHVDRVPDAELEGHRLLPDRRSRRHRGHPALLYVRRCRARAARDGAAGRCLRRCERGIRRRNGLRGAARGRARTERRSEAGAPAAGTIRRHGGNGVRNQVQLITYVDRLGGGGIRELQALLAGPLAGLFGGAHLLPFFHPIDGVDAGFDPIDHTRVDARLGDWHDIRALSADLELMADVIVNHVSRESPQFLDYAAHGADSPYAGMFLTLDAVFPAGATERELTAIYRPRPGLPFSPATVGAGERRLLWTTFSPQQVDIDVEHEEGRAYLASILDTFAANGVRMARLDAVGYAIKRAGTRCFMIPETFEFIDRFTALAHRRGIEVLVEVHSYYRDQIAIASRVDWVYDFALPPLVLHAFAYRTAERLAEWIAIRPSNALTVLDTHDGIGIIDVGADPADRAARPGLVPDAELDYLVESIHERSQGESRLATGAAASNLDLYQVNCTFYDALGRDDREYLIARAVQLFLPGVPQVYYVGLLAGLNDTELLARTQVGRDINRHYFGPGEIETALSRPVVRDLLTLIRLRNSHPAFAGAFESQLVGPAGLRLTWTRGAERAELAVSFADATLVLRLAAATGVAAAGAPPMTAGLAWRGSSVSVTSSTGADGLRRYRLQARDPRGGMTERSVAESGERPRLRTPSRLLDALFALTMQEVADDSVASIRDAAFNDGRPIACACFETGERWHYVWTRDVSYAADLGLALLEPGRTRASLEFKVSPLRAELLAAGVAPATVVAEDTGSGGSWPVSTDRVVWLHAAARVLDALGGAEADGFARRLYAIASDTLAEDREFAFDAALGLYRGETSFLDWREQTYPAFTARDTRFIAESFALSTNVLHYLALRDLDALDRRLHGTALGAAASEADALRAAIDRAFWLEADGLYASYLAPGLVPQPLRTFDLLGESLAVIAGIADERKARLIARGYPRTEVGPPVVFPERPGVGIYHSRAMWPFVTSYALRAAARANKPEVAAAALRSLWRGTALALSNMENFEFLSGSTHVDDGPLSGPVINSPRQLWSVAAFAGSAIEVLWGVEPASGGLRVHPFVPAETAAALGAAGRSLWLRDLRFRGARLDVELRVPAALPAGAWLEARRVRVDGRAQPEGRVPLAALRPVGVTRIVVDLRVGGRAPPAPAALLVQDPGSLTDAERAGLFAPAAPERASGRRTGELLEIEPPAPVPGTTLALLDDRGTRRTLGPGTAGAVRLPAPGTTACVAFIARGPVAGLDSLPGPDRCWPADGFFESVPAGDPRLSAPGATLGADADGAPAYVDWGGIHDELSLDVPGWGDGLLRVRLEYRNAHGPVNTGVTAAVKRIRANCGSQAAAQQGAIVMPHVATADGPALSTGFVFRARAGERCRLELSDGLNMSYLQHFALYTGGAGGRAGALNRATIRAVRIERVAVP